MGTETNSQSTAHFSCWAEVKSKNNPRAFVMEVPVFAAEHVPPNELALMCEAAPEWARNRAGGDDDHPDVIAIMYPGDIDDLLLRVGEDDDVEYPEFPGTQALCRAVQASGFIYLRISGECGTDYFDLPRYE